MRKNIIFAGLFILMLLSPILVFAGPIKSKGEKIIPIDYGAGETVVIIVSESGFRFWWYDENEELIRKSVCLYTYGINQNAIDKKIADGWIYNDGLAETAALYPYVGGAPFLHKESIDMLDT